MEGIKEFWRSVVRGFVLSKWALYEPPPELGCFDCGRPYSLGPDLVLPNDVWAQIAPNPPDGGVLCPNCIHDRLVALRMPIGSVRAKFTSGPMARLR